MQNRSRCGRGLHEGPHSLPGGKVPEQDHQHPPGPPSLLPRGERPGPGLRLRREDNGVHHPFHRRGNRYGTHHHAVTRGDKFRRHGLVALREDPGGRTQDPSIIGEALLRGEAEGHGEQGVHKIGLARKPVISVRISSLNPCPGCGKIFQCRRPPAFCRSPGRHGGARGTPPSPLRSCRSCRRVCSEPL